LNQSFNFALILGSERSPGYELPGVPAEEALAERSLPAHQVHDGSCPEALLRAAAAIAHRLPCTGFLVARNKETYYCSYFFVIFCLLHEENSTF
jgi:hypothetical protein